MWRDCFKLPDGWTPAQGQEGRGAGGGRGRGRGGRGGRGGGAASMKSTGNESESRDDRFPGQFFFVSTQASAGPEKDEGFEEPAAVGKVTLHSLDYWVIDSGATYSMTPRADLLTELEPSPVKHVTSGSSGGGGGSGGTGSGGGRPGVVPRGGCGGGQRQQQQQRRSETPSPQQLQLLRSGVAIFDLDYDAILAAMYALSVSAEGDCYLRMPPDRGIEAAALGASESSLLGSASAEVLHTFTLDSGAFRCFFNDSTILTPLSTPVPVRLADPSGGPVLACSSSVLPCPAIPSGSLLGLHLPLFSTNLVSTAALQDAMVTTTTPGGQRVSICTYTRTGRHLATFTRRPGSSLYTLATAPPQVAASAQVSASGQVAPPCSCRLLSHQTLPRHHCLGHPSLPRLRGMHSRLLVSGLPRSLPLLLPSPAPPCLPCVEGRQRAAPHSSSLPPTIAPLQTLHMDVWGPACVSGQGRERYFLLVVDDYMRYITIFPLRTKGEDLPVLCLHSDRGGEFSSNLLRDFYRGEGILQSFTLPASPQQNGIAEHRIGLVMNVARTSVIHAADVKRMNDDE
ncbi:unnamed protein product [Closterium sp. NIES-53]